jgi:hypothetical protein
MDESSKATSSNELMEKLYARMKKRGYWCDDCDCLAPPQSLENNILGGDGCCPNCGKNPRDKTVKPEEVAQLN